MKRLSIIMMTVFAVGFSLFISSDAKFETISFKEDALASAEYGSCEVHTYDTDYIVINEATCESKGTKWRACSVCGYRDIVETPKNKDNHTKVKDEWLYFPSPTCVTGGKKYKVCYGCNGQVDIADVSADPTAHSKSGETVVIKDATCTTKGIVADVCKYCGKTFNEVESPINEDNHITSDFSVWNISKLPTCSTAGEIVCNCDNCGKIAITKKIAATGVHYHDDVIHIDKEPNCTENGIKSYHCVECGMSMEAQVIPSEPNKHIYSDEFIIDKNATCISTGEKSKHCLCCDERIEITEIPVDAQGHKFSSEWIVEKEATCSEMGLKYTECTLCGERSIPVGIPKSEHTYGDYEIIQESADGLSAKVKYTCTVCGHEKEDIVVFKDNNDNGDISDGTKKQYKLKLKATSIFVVDYDNFTVSNIARNMTVSKFNDNFTNINSCVIYNKSNNVVNEEALIATGYRINYQDVTGIVTNYKVSVTGDVNSDGKVTSADARLILRAAAHIENFENEFFIAADVNCDNKITASDARKTLRVAANLTYFESTYKN